ncbi:MAG: MauE/DoxX family redox-associated membrane protein [Dehalococcoidia bacterium]
MPSEDVDLEQQAAERLPEPVRGRLEDFDRALTGFLQDHGLTLLRLALGVVYIWFGVLKVVDRSPVEDLVQDVVFFADGDWVVPAMGVWEIIIGFGLIFPVALRITLLMMVAQLVGTMSAFFVVPGRCFQDGNPLLLTTTGEFVVKNLVLISAGLAIGATVRHRRRTIPVG